MGQRSLAQAEFGYYLGRLSFAADFGQLTQSIERNRNRRGGCKISFYSMPPLPFFHDVADIALVNLMWVD